MLASQLVNDLSRWALSVPADLGEHELHRRVVKALKGWGLQPKDEHRIRNGDYWSRIDIYVPLAEEPHLLIELKTDGDWRSVSWATWQLYQASALMAVGREPIATERLLICGTSLADPMLRNFLRKNKIAYAEASGRS